MIIFVVQNFATMDLKRKILFLLCPVGVLLACCGCAEDRTSQYEEKTSEARWVENTVEEWYLWADSMPEVGWKDYFYGSEAFLKALTSKIHPADRWSYCEVDSLGKDYHRRGYFDHLDSYGMDVALMTDPTGMTSRQYARVISVYEGSPAERCGLERNDFISYVNGQKVASSNMKSFFSGLARTLVVSKLSYDLDAQMFLWSKTDTVELSRSEYVEDKAFPVDSVYDINGYNVGYLMCSRLVSGAAEQGGADGVYRMALDNIMDEMKQKSVDAMILDLRLCNYGEMPMVCRLLSYLTGKGGDAVLQTLWKDGKESMNETFVFDTSVTKSLGLERVYVITGGYTQGAAEWLIQGLKGALGEDNVLTFGSQTAGQNVWLHPVESADGGVTLHLASAYVADTDGNYDYSDGHAPLVPIDEFSFAELYPYGDLREVLLAEVIRIMIPYEGM